MKKYLSVLAASLFILSAAGCAASGVNGGFPGADMDHAPAMAAGELSEGGAAGIGGGSVAGHGTPVSASTAADSFSDTTAGDSSPSAEDTGSTSSEKPAVSSAETSATKPSSTKPSSTKAESTEPAAKPVDAVPADEKSEAYSPTDIGGVGSGAYADDSVAADGFFDGAEIAEDIAYEADADYVGDDIACPIDPWDPWEDPRDDYYDYQPSAGLLTGGEWRDNDHWADWKALYSTHDDWELYRGVWRVNYENRAAVSVTSGGAPVEGAKVSCANGTSAVTDNKGRAYVFYAADSGDITVEYNGETKTADGISGDGSADVELDGAAEKLNKLDFMIMCDTTGSMSDELRYLQAELSDIITKIQKDNANTDIRLSVNFYRDEGDEYVVREYPFTEDINAAAGAIGEQRADGGGDYPEAVHTALNSAVNNHDWDEDSVKIMFLVLDAPPHSEDVQIVDSVRRYTEQAAEMGIRIIPIASSGVDKSTEYLLRTMSFVTGGTYTFLTDDSGVGNGHIEPTVGAYNVEKLNDMMVRIVNGYLS